MDCEDTLLNNKYSLNVFEAFGCGGSHMYPSTQKAKAGMTSNSKVQGKLHSIIKEHNMLI